LSGYGTYQLLLDGGNVWSLPDTGGNWLKTNSTITVGSVGWHTVAVYGQNFLKAFPGNEGVDYLRIGREPEGILMMLR